MNYFSYKVQNPVSGKVISSVLTADDIESAEDTLKTRGETILEIDYMQDVLGLRKLFVDFSGKITKKIACEFFSMLAFLLEAGMSLHEALVSIRDSSINKRLCTLTRSIADDVRQGISLSHAMSRTGRFNQGVIEQISAGENSGDMPDALKRLTRQTENELEFASNIKSAMIYPLIITVVMVIVLWALMTIVVPSLSKTLLDMGGELPLVTKLAIGASNLISRLTPFLIPVVLAGIIAYRILMKNPAFKYKADSLKLRIPIVGIILLKLEMSRFCRNLYAMQISGITLVISLKITGATIRNSKIQTAILQAANIVEISGMNLSSALTKIGKWPDLMMQLIDVGVSSGQLCDVLEKIAIQYEREVDSSLKRISSLIEPAMILAVGLLAGTVVIAIFLPMFDLMSVF